MTLSQPPESVAAFITAEIERKIETMIAARVDGARASAGTGDDRSAPEYWRARARVYRAEADAGEILARAMTPHQAERVARFYAVSHCLAHTQRAHQRATAAGWDAGADLLERIALFGNPDDRHSFAFALRTAARSGGVDL